MKGEMKEMFCHEAAKEIFPTSNSAYVISFFTVSGPNRI